MAKRGRKPALHHYLIIDTIQRLLDNELPGKKRKVMILTPPGSAKSTYTSQELPPWFVNKDRNPQDLILACSYSYDLVEGFGRFARDTLTLDAPILGVTVSKTASASGDWRVHVDDNTPETGGYFCGGVGSGIAGHRARLGLIDDYLGSEQDAQSEKLRKTIWDWYWNDFVPRLLPDAWQVIIANRRHEDDLIGRLMAHDPSGWHIIRLPMLAEDDDPLGRTFGERLWPEWFTEQQVKDAQALPTTWAGLYQQRPHPPDGDFFKAEDIMTYTPDMLPKELRKYVGSDYALKTKNRNDFTCFLPAGMDPNGNLWILPDWFWKRVNSYQAVQEMLNVVRRHRPITWWAGRENIVGSIEPFLNEEMRKQNTFVAVEQLSESADKEQKAQSIRARCSARTVFFPKFAPQWADAYSQLMSFPNGTFDDFVDALAKLGQGLDTFVRPGVPKDQNFILTPPRLTWGWVKDSAKRRERAEIYASNYDS